MLRLFQFVASSLTPDETDRSADHLPSGFSSLPTRYSLVYNMVESYSLLR
eukprot:m.349704 g.349704  ORF g.349704 m.349704 type:complete len:50 (+) comp43594_c0_seq1:28-177(+)